MMSGLLEQVQDFFAAHETLLGVAGALSLMMFVGSAVLIPWLLVRLPEDYFASRRRHSWLRERRSPFFYLPLRLLKNVLGLTLVLLGLLMLFLPGQGLLTIFIGVVLTDFPRKYKLEGWLLRRPAIRNSTTWLRHRYGRPPLRF